MADPKTKNRTLNDSIKIPPEILLELSEKPHLLLDEVERRLDQYIIGQEDVRRFIARALCDHARDFIAEKYRPKKGLLLVGPTGSGKSYTVQTIARMFDFPYVDKDLTQVTAAGYQGEKIHHVLKQLVTEAKTIIGEEALKKDPDKDIRLAQWGIVLFDELDKISKNKDYKGKDVSGEDVQYELLRFLEGGTYSLDEKDGRKIYTSNVFFALTGAFEGMQGSKEESGLSLEPDESDFDDTPKDESEKIYRASTEDIINYGINRQLLGRIGGNLLTLQKLTKDELKEVLVKAKNSQTGKSLLDLTLESMRDYYPNIRFSRDAINYIVDSAHDMNLGARALDGICKSIDTRIIDYLRSQKVSSEEKIRISSDLIQKALSYR